MNKIILYGRLTKNPELRDTQKGDSVANFTLAVSRNFTNKDGERDTDFIPCVAWNKQAEFISKHFQKGQPMLLEGRLQIRIYDDEDGNRHWLSEVMAEKIEFASRWSEEVSCDENNG